MPPEDTSVLGEAQEEPEQSDERSRCSDEETQTQEDSGQEGEGPRGAQGAEHTSLEGRAEDDARSSANREQSSRYVAGEEPESE